MVKVQRTASRASLSRFESLCYRHWWWDLPLGVSAAVKWGWESEHQTYGAVRSMECKDWRHTKQLEQASAHSKCSVCVHGDPSPPSSFQSRSLHALEKLFLCSTDINWGKKYVTQTSAAVCSEAWGGNIENKQEPPKRNQRDGFSLGRKFSGRIH